MKDFPFRESPDTLVVICSHLSKGADLHWVHHVPGEEFIWQFMCNSEHERSNMMEKTLMEAYQRFPEIGELANTPPNMDVSFKKGKNSGKWYDFHRG
jgi:hypothetical protein